MEIIKEYCEGANKFVIRTNTYGRNWKHLEKLLNVAKVDFPSLNEADVDIVQFAGIKYARTFGIEFMVKEEPKDDYIRIEQLEYTF